MPRSCAEPAGIPALLSPRDKLAQLLVVGVRDAADAQAVVTNYHVGGILIGSDTDLTIFDGALAEIVAGGGPLPLAVSVDEEGGRVSRLRSLIGGTGPSARELAQTRTVQQVRDLARDRGRQMRKLGITIDFAPVVDVTDAPDDTVIGTGRSARIRLRSPRMPGRTRRVCAMPGCCRCSSISPVTGVARVIRTTGVSRHHRLMTWWAMTWCPTERW